MIPKLSAPHLPITQSALVSLLATLVGNAAALVPSWAPLQATIIQGGTFAIAIAFLIANALHARASKAPAPIPLTPTWGVQTGNASTVSNLTLRDNVVQPAPVDEPDTAVWFANRQPVPDPVGAEPTTLEPQT